MLLKLRPEIRCIGVNFIGPCSPIFSHHYTHSFAQLVQGYMNLKLQVDRVMVASDVLTDTTGEEMTVDEAIEIIQVIVGFYFARLKKHVLSNFRPIAAAQRAGPARQATCSARERAS